MTKLTRAEVIAFIFLYFVFGFISGYKICTEIKGNQDIKFVEVEKLVEVAEYIETKTPTEKIYIDYELTMDNCHKRNDIKIGDTVWFAFLGSWTFDEPVDFIVADGIKVGYESQTVTHIQHDMIEGRDCITSINGYGITPQKTKEDMLNIIENHLKFGHLDY